jgi:hypothetical protein
VEDSVNAIGATFEGVCLHLLPELLHGTGLGYPPATASTPVLQFLALGKDGHHQGTLPRMIIRMVAKNLFEMSTIIPEDKLICTGITDKDIPVLNNLTFWNWHNALLCNICCS